MSGKDAAYWRARYWRNPEKAIASVRRSKQKRLEADPTYREVLKQRAREYRVANRDAIAARRRRTGTSSSRGEVSSSFGLVNSVFALGAVTPVQGAVAERREGGEGPLSDDSFKESTWRAPWGPGYALHRPKSTS